jgi:hypothetical protein
MPVICSVWAAGGSLGPFVVSSQVNDKVIETLQIEGFRTSVNIVLEHRQKGYVTATLFQQYGTNVPIPFIERLRTNLEFTGKSVILLLDNCFIHTRPEVLAISRDHSVKVITFPPHTTQIFQTPGLCLFGVFKRKMQYKLPFANENLTVNLFERGFTHWSKRFFQRMSGVHLNCLDLNLILLKLRTHCCFERTNCAEVESSRRFGKLTIPWTNSPKEVEKRDLNGTINMNGGDKSTFSVTLRARSENICSWTLTSHLELYSFLRW